MNISLWTFLMQIYGGVCSDVQGFQKPQGFYPGVWRVGVRVSVAAALAGVFAILVNKICKIMKIFERLDHLKS
jgi:hypothetical protein